MMDAAESAAWGVRLAATPWVKWDLIAKTLGVAATDLDARARLQNQHELIPAGPLNFGHCI